MTRRSERRIVLVVRPTRLEELICRFNTRDQARFYIEHLGADFSDYEAEHATYHRSVQHAQEVLDGAGRLQTVQRKFVPNFVFGDDDTVVVLGQDGLVANVLKYLERQPVIGINPDPTRWEGALLPFSTADLGGVVAQTLRNERAVRSVTMARIELNTGETLYGVNDLFIGPKSHTSARYEIAYDGDTEHQSSSGIIVSTGLGSTGWFRSVMAGAAGIAAACCPGDVRIEPTPDHSWDARFLYFSVREPWPSTTTSAHVTFGKITAGTPLRMRSHMPEHGVVFSDGMEQDFLRFNSGTEAVVTVAERRGHVVV